LGLVTTGLCLSKALSVFAVPDTLEARPDGPSIGLMALIAALPCSEPLGYACLRGLGNPQISPSKLAQFLIGELDLKKNDYSAPRIRRKIRQRIGMDFEENKVVNVDGWCLSLTETRLYAISFLHRSTAHETDFPLK